MIQKFLFALLLTPALAPAAVKSARNCEVNVTYNLKLGISEKKTYRIPANSEKDCMKKSRIYSLNTTPQATKSKTVRVKWLGK